MSFRTVTYPRHAAVFFATFLCAFGEAAPQASAKVVITRGERSLRVEIDGKLFTEYVFKGGHKPIFYPVIGPHGGGITRNYPMKKVSGEAEDHPHHRSLWFTHGSVNGVDFWLESSEGGKILHEKFLRVSSGDKGIIESENVWNAPDGKKVCSDRRKMTCSSFPGGTFLDFEVTVRASEGPVTFGDTKEGTMGIRTHPNLRLDNDAKRGVTTASGHALNSEGHRDHELWGKRAKWVDYWGKIDGHTVGVAIFDHPQNPRHPTWWHARNYGLVAANAFGVHNFEKKPEGTGDFLIEEGNSVTFKYRFVFHKGSADEAKIGELYSQYAAK